MVLPVRRIDLFSYSDVLQADSIIIMAELPADLFV